VNNLSFGLEYGECFALLGITGAGKTTTFKCLTGEESADTGQLYMGGFDVRTSKGYDQARCMMGYCPQFDAFFDTLTVREHLEFYARIKGIPRSYREELIDKQIREMDLVEYVHS
jgi:ABC-type multidrug transport system ATPase subunit